MGEKRSMQALIAANDSIVELLALSNEYEEKGELKTAIAYAQQAFAAIQAVNAVSFLPLAQARLARLLIYTGVNQPGQDFAQRVIENDADSALSADARISLGVSAADAGNLEEAEGYFHQAIELSRRLEEYLLLGRALHNLAMNVYLPRGQFDLALACMREAQHFRAAQETHQWGLPFLQALVAELTGRNRQARQALDDLLPLLRPTDRITGGYFYLWARLAIAEGEFNRAEEYLHLLMRIATTTGATDLNIWARVEQARFYRLKGEPATGRTWAEDGLKCAQRLGNVIMAGQAALEYAQCARQAGDAAQAYSSLQAAIGTFTRCGAVFDLAAARFLDAAWAFQDQSGDAGEKWQAAAAAILSGDFGFLLEKEHETAFPIIAAYQRSSSVPARKAAEALLNRLERVAPPPLRINGLGSFQVWQGRKLIADAAWQRRKAGELFRFLLLQPGFSAGREAILEALWPEHDPQAAVGMLHQATSTLRHVLEPDLPDKFPSRYLSVEGERVTLALPGGSQVDFLEFEQQINKALTAARIDQLKSALNIARGALFPSDRYADWCASRRERITNLFHRGMQVLGQQHLAQGSCFEALECSRAIIREDPWNEDAVLLGMNAYLGLQDAPHALRLYQRLEQTLRDDLALTPRTDLADLARSLQTPTSQRRK